MQGVGSAPPHKRKSGDPEQNIKGFSSPLPWFFLPRPRGKGNLGEPRFCFSTHLPPPLLGKQPRPLLWLASFLPSPKGGFGPDDPIHSPIHLGLMSDPIHSLFLQQLGEAGVLYFRVFFFKKRKEKKDRCHKRGRQKLCGRRRKPSGELCTKKKSTGKRVLLCGADSGDGDGVTTKGREFEGP